MTQHCQPGSILFDFEDCPIPSRSRLHHLLPIGFLTESVESLTSYTSRVAAAHDITAATLFGWEIAPLIDRRFLRHSEQRANRSSLLTISFRPLVRAINGTGAISSDFIDALQRLTLRTDLRFLTMITWRNIFPHMHLLRGTRAWCPACLGKSTDVKVQYEKLIWCLDAVKACSLHGRWLHTVCPFCNRSQPVLASRTLPGRCSSCAEWLGEDPTLGSSGTESLSGHELVKQRWITDQVGQLLKIGPSLSNGPERSTIAESVKCCIKLSHYRGESAFAKGLGLPQSSVNEWKNGRSLPGLDSALRICLATGTPLLDFALGRMPNHPTRKINPAKVTEENKKRYRHPRRWTSTEVNGAERTLRTMISQHPPVPLVNIARCIDRPLPSLYLKFPGLCTKAATQYKEFQNAARRQCVKTAIENLDEIVAGARNLSLRGVALSLGCASTTLKGHRGLLTARLAAERRKRSRARWRILEVMIRNSIISDTPRNLRQIAKHGRCSHSSLYLRFPKLCRRLATRYQEYLKDQSAQRKEELRLQVRQAALSIHLDGRYPSVRRVEKRLSRSKNLRSSSIALQVLREVRLELGLH
jgi:transcriptional regulator with XRE-family HTH domain